MLLYVLFHCVNAPHFPYLVIQWWTLGLILYLGICEQCCNKIGMPISLQYTDFTLVEIYPEVKFVDHTFALFLSSFPRNLCNDFCNSCTNLNTHQLHVRSSCFLHKLVSIFHFSSFWKLLYQGKIISLWVSFAFSDDYWSREFSKYLLIILYIFPWKCLFFIGFIVELSYLTG